MIKYRIVASKIAPKDTDGVLWLDYNAGVLKAFDKGTWEPLGSEKQGWGCLLGSGC